MTDQLHPVPTPLDAGRRQRRRPSMQACLLGLILVAVLLGAAALVWQRAELLDEAEGSAEDQLALLASLAAQDIDDAITLTQTSMAQLAANPSLQPVFAGDTAPGDCALTFTGAGPFTDGALHLVDRGGTVRCSSLDPPPDPGAYADRPWLDAPDAMVSGPTMDPAGEHEALFVSAPVPDAGTAVTVLDVTTVDEELARSLSGPWPVQVSLLTEGEPSKDDDSHISAEAQVASVPWRVQANVAQGDALRDARAMSGQLLTYGALALGVLGLLTLAVYRAITRPIEQLAHAMRSGSQGAQLPVLPTGGPAEVAELVSSFDSLRENMTAELDRRRDAEARYRVLFESNPHAMWVHHDATGEIVDANDAAARLSGRATSDLVGSHYSEMIAPEARPLTIETFAGDALIERAGPWALLDGNDGARDCEISSVPLRLGRDWGRLVIAEDVTDQLRVQRLLAQRERMDSLGQLAGGIAHDFNNVLSVVLGYTDFVTEAIKDVAGSDPQRWDPVLEDTKRITQAGRSAAELTGQLMAFARGDASAVEPLDLNDVITDVEPLLRRTLGEHINLQTSLERPLWHVATNRGQVEQVIVNLAVNARDAMPDGGRLLIETTNLDVDDDSASTRPGVEPGPHVRLRVSDTGIGMDATVRDRAFEPLFTTKGGGKGTGLGLATVYGIVTGAGGSLSIYSEPNMGTSISALFPISDAHASTAPESTPRPAVRAGQEAILVVEDDDNLHAVTERILTTAGYEVISATNGAEALDALALHQDRIRLLLTDIVMPGMSGPELAQRVHQINPDLPVVFMSGYSPPLLLGGTSLPAGAALIDKPFSRDQLLHAVRDALDARRSGSD